MKIAIVSRLVEVAGELAQRLAHEPGLQAHVAVAHLAFDLGAGHECGHGVDDDHVERARPDQHVGDLEALLTRVGLADQEVVDVHADRTPVDRVHGVLGVDVAHTFRHCAGPRRPRASRAWTCPRTPARRSRRPAPAATRRCPRARSRASAPVGMASTPTLPRSPNFMIDPLPNCLSIWASAISSAFSRSTSKPLFCLFGLVVFGGEAVESEPNEGVRH